MRQPISAIEAGFKLCQDGRFIVNFDTRETHERDGEWTNALDGPSLTLPHWRSAYESAGEQGIWFVLLSGETKHIKPGENRDAASRRRRVRQGVARDRAGRQSSWRVRFRSRCLLIVRSRSWSSTSCGTGRPTTRPWAGPTCTASSPPSGCRDNQPLLWTGPRRVRMLFYSSARFARRVAGHRVIMWRSATP